MEDDTLSLDQLQKRMNWGLRDIDYQLRAENLIIVRRGGKLKFVFLTHVTAPEQQKTREPAKDVAKHVGRKYASN
jgi:hypothetical protein